MPLSCKGGVPIKFNHNHAVTSDYYETAHAHTQINDLRDVI